jgi:hypothetical protein
VASASISTAATETPLDPLRTKTNRSLVYRRKTQNGENTSRLWTIKSCRMRLGGLADSATGRTPAPPVVAQARDATEARFTQTRPTFARMPDPLNDARTATEDGNCAGALGRAGSAVSDRSRDAHLRLAVDRELLGARP